MKPRQPISSVPGRDAPSTRSGRLGLPLLLWLVGVPLPIVLIVLMVRGCG